MTVLPAPSGAGSPQGPRTLDADRQVKGSIAKTVLSYVRRALGEDAVADVLATVVGHGSTADLMAPASWTSPAYTIAIANAAAATCGDADIGRRAGEELMRIQQERGTLDFLRSAGSVVAALELAANVGTKMSAGRVIEVAASGDGWATIEARYGRPTDAHPFFCGQAAGYYGHVPEVFGFNGVITEPECMSRGDERCVYRLRWSAASDDGRIEDSAITASRERASGLIERFEQLHSMATELATAEEVDTLLARIGDRAGFAIDAPRYLLAVRMTDGGRIRVQQRGIEPDRVDRLAAQLLAGELKEHRGCIIADVSSGGRVYGRVVALYPRGSSATEVDHRLLRAYARHAAAALDAVASLERARRDRDTAEAMLALAKGLAEAGTRSEVATRLAAAVPGVAACDVARVWLWDAAEECLRLAARHPVASDDERNVIRLTDMAELAALIANPVPTVIDIERAPDSARKVMEADGVRQSAIVPMTARGVFLGVIAAEYARSEVDGELDVETDLLARLAGLADQAATAIDNADLLARVRDEALHDSLTGLPNRRLMEDRARLALDRIDRSRPLSLLFIDLDRFKNVNDTLGHEVGDELIRQAAERLRRGLRSTDTLARLGGDEFVVMLTDIADESEAQSAAARMLSAFREPFHLPGHDVFISCSIGVAHAPVHGSDYATLLRRADSAMYMAKRQGRGVSAEYTDAASTSNATRLGLETDLHTAVERDQLHLLYQPQVDLRSRRIVGVEALVRWDHPTRGRITPDDFLPLAEEAGLMQEIDEWVHSTAIAQARRWLDRGINLRIAVNLSTAALHDVTLAERIGKQLEALDLDPAQLEVEITDRVVVSDDDLPRLLRPLRDLGVRLAIDDFGTGTSVIGRLDGCGISTLKIDRSFVRGIDGTGASAPIVRALLAMASALDLQVVAEGVETEPQAALLAAAGCELAQGYLFSRPVEPTEIEQLCLPRCSDLR